MPRPLLILLVCGVLVAALPLVWRLLARTVNTQVRRINR
ncbi:hypothetical protein FHS44_006384 [Streptosporangium saharense]|uniref:Uncharacterized protein n=1 Tax=Streptosporangium saharense TaxID=1706840 RepID=A0A7W7VQP1_9ACTN|nr:hypothetical protein [Streptosporangium saharense]